MARGATMTEVADTWTMTRTLTQQRGRLEARERTGTAVRSGRKECGVGKQCFGLATQSLTCPAVLWGVYVSEARAETVSYRQVSRSLGGQERCTAAEVPVVHPGAKGDAAHT
eukprot:4300-Rhodomonas_salina.1